MVCFFFVFFLCTSHLAKYTQLTIALLRGININMSKYTLPDFGFVSVQCCLHGATNATNHLAPAAQPPRAVCMLLVELAAADLLV